MLLSPTTIDWPHHSIQIVILIKEVVGSQYKESNKVCFARRGGENNMRHRARYNQTTVIYKSNQQSEGQSIIERTRAEYAKGKLSLILSFVATVAIAVVCVLVILPADIILGMVALIVARILRLERLAPCLVLVACIWWRHRRLIIIPGIWSVGTVQISNAAILSFQRDVRLPRSLSREEALLPLLAASP